MIIHSRQLVTVVNEFGLNNVPGQGHAPEPCYAPIVIRHRAPWERDPELDEDDDAFDAFVQYLKHPTRFVADFARSTGRNPSTVQIWSARYHWRSRREAFKAHLAREAFEAAEAEARDLGAELARCRAMMVDTLWDSLVFHRARGNVLPIDKIAPFAKSIEDSVALAEGKPTARVEVQDPAAYLRDLATRLEQAQGRADGPVVDPAEVSDEDDPE